MATEADEAQQEFNRKYGWTQDDERQLAHDMDDAGWVAREPSAPAPGPKYWPLWTDPAFDPAIQVSPDGLRQRPASRGGMALRLRPAILPVDRASNPTDYALRFGIHPDRRRNPADQSRSRLTPTSQAFTSSTGAGNRSWGEDESYQTWLLQGLTSEELIAAGAYEPDRNVPAPDLAMGIHELFRRGRWTQAPVPTPNTLALVAKEPLETGFRYWFGARQGVYDAWRNQDIWDALLPSLRLASAVLQARPAAWAMMLDFTRALRKVPLDADGRTAARKAEPGFRPFKSLWLPDSVPAAGYDEYGPARALHALGFDASKAVMALLERDMKLSIVRGGPLGLAGSFKDDKGKVKHRVCVGAELVWPLLVPEFSASEKLPYRILIAKVLVHELIHTCRYTHNEMLFYPEDVQKMTIPDFQLTDDMCRLLHALKDEIHGPGGDPMTACVGQYFFQDESQLEEGKAFDNQVWGGDFNHFPNNAVGTLNPVLSQSRWPWAHRDIYAQNKAAVDAGEYEAFATGDSYTSFLLHPPAPAFNFFTLLPIASYEGFLAASWWQTDFVKYGTAGLKLQLSPPGDSSAPPPPAHHAARSLFMPGEGQPFVALLMEIMPAECVVFLDATVWALRNAGHSLAGTFLWEAVLYMVTPEMQSRRLAAEQLTWPRTYGVEMAGLATHVTDELAALEGALGDLARADVPQLLMGPLIERLQALLRGGLLELHRRVTYHVLQYAQSVIAVYLVQPAHRRSVLAPQMRQLRTSLRPLRNLLARLVRALDAWHPLLLRDAHQQPLRLGDDGAVLADLALLLRPLPPPAAADPARADADIAALTSPLLLPAVRAAAGPLRQDAVLFDDVLRLLTDDALRGRGAAAAPPLAWLPLAQRRTLGTVGRLDAAATEALSQVQDPLLQKMLRICWDILAPYGAPISALGPQGPGPSH